MHLQLGDHAFDLTTRGLVVASVLASELTKFGSADSSFEALLSQPPALIEITGSDLAWVAPAVQHAASKFPGPIGVRTQRADVAFAAIEAGASFVHDPSGLADPAYLRVVEWSKAGLMIGAPQAVIDETAFLIERARWAAAVGIGPVRLVLASKLGTVESLQGHGYTAMVTTPQNTDAQGANALAMSKGARIIASNQVRATKRTIDVVSELLERRDKLETV